MKISDLDALDEGFVMDMMTEAGNDSYTDYKQLATQEDFERFAHGG